MMDKMVLVLVLALGILVVYASLKFLDRIVDRLEEDIRMGLKSDEQKEE